MSKAEKPAVIDHCTLPVSAHTLSTSLPVVDEALSARVYEELGRLAEFMPQRYREVFCFRWGLRGEFSHLATQVAVKFEMPKSTVDAMLIQCVWNAARHAHSQPLPALRELLGEDRQRWAERAWAHAELRWGQHDSQRAQTALLLALAGLDVPEAQRVADQHMADVRLRQTSRSRRPLSDEEKTEAARHGVDRMLAHVIWPTDTATLGNLDAFSLRRPLPAWTPAKNGVFASRKVDRLVQFDSDLELHILRELDADPRIADYQEQPVTIPYVLDGEPHEYTPDVIARMSDGRAFIIEAKPLEHLGDFTNWMKWASLARWCEHAGLGFWIGSPQRSIIEHRGMQPDPERRELVADEVRAAAVTGAQCTALTSLVGKDQLGIIATTELLDWRTEPRWRIRHAEGVDREEAQRFWALIDQHPSTAPAAGCTPTCREEVIR